MKKKQMLCLLLTVCMIAGNTPMTVTAADGGGNERDCGGDCFRQ